MTSAKLKSFILNALLPQFCLGCLREGVSLCYDCLSTITLNPAQPVKLPNKNLNGFLAAASYQNQLVKKAIGNFKYQPFNKTLAFPLTYLIIAQFLKAQNKTRMFSGENSVLIPVPLYFKQERKRGFNQAELIAQELSRFFKTPLLFNNLIRIKKTGSQTKLNKKQRQKNIENAFTLKNPEKLFGKKVLLIDDVLTTGATMEECAKVLKQAGAQQVWGIAVAFENKEV